MFTFYIRHIYFLVTLNAKMFGENIFGEQMFGGFFIKSPKISVNNFGEKGFWNFPPKTSFSSHTTF